MTLTKTSAAELFATKFWPYKSPALAEHFLSLKMAGLGLTSDLSVYKLVGKVPTDSEIQGRLTFVTCYSTHLYIMCKTRDSNTF